MKYALIYALVVVLLASSMPNVAQCYTHIRCGYAMVSVKSSALIGVYAYICNMSSVIYSPGVSYWVAVIFQPFAWISAGLATIWLAPDGDLNVIHIKHPLQFR